MLIDDLLEESKPEGGDGDNFTFTASTGRVFTAKQVQSADALTGIFKRAKSLEARSETNTPPTWHDYLPISENVAQGVAFIEKSLVEPKLSTLDALRLANRRGGYFLEITGNLKMAALVGQATRDQEEIDDLGEASGEILSDATC